MVGSQSILGTFGEDELPPRATMPGEVEILPIAGSNEEIVQFADRIEGVAGEFSPFEELHGPDASHSPGQVPSDAGLRIGRVAAPVRRPVTWHRPIRKRVREIACTGKSRRQPGSISQYISRLLI